MTNTSTQQVACPNCRTMVEWSATNPHRPFCSDQCRNKDFIAWANEQIVIQGNPIYDDVLSDDLRDY